MNVRLRLQGQQERVQEQGTGDTQALCQEGEAGEREKESEGKKKTKKGKKKTKKGKMLK